MERTNAQHLGIYERVSAGASQYRLHPSHHLGLSATNAILIVEFARQLHAEDHTLIDAAVTAARLRLRPILMTSLAFTLGVVPLMLASGASAETQHAIGTGVFGGMLSVTLLAIFFVPAFFVFVIGTQERLSAWLARHNTAK
ncbi:efflux RND transporter permease subunit [Shewanella sp.]|uniref:efflux RND transporter permease subunit n=1 Tax=unclassified Shewanella TaxID=196818 RepID=UPI003569D119